MMTLASTALLRGGTKWLKREWAKRSWRQCVCAIEWCDFPKGGGEGSREIIIFLNTSHNAIFVG